MAGRERIGRIALASLGLALLTAVAGRLIERLAGWEFVGGLVEAFGDEQERRTPDQPGSCQHEPVVHVSVAEGSVW